MIDHNALTLLSKMGQGGFGTVYRAIYVQDKKADAAQPAAEGLGESKFSSFFSLACFKSSEQEENRLVAAKEMKGEQHLCMHELLKEACVMASLRHPNVCAFVGVSADKAKNKLYIISELAECSLFDVVHTPHKIRWTGELTAQVAVDLSQGICAGIMYLHSCSLVHADLKSSNILVNFSGAQVTPLICDFGHAAVRSTPSPHHRCGTPHWAAPEVLRGEALGPAADVYSVGVMLWEMLSLRLPHRGLSFCQVIGAVGYAGWVPEMALLPEGLPGGLRRLLQLCLSFPPKGRPSARETQVQLRRLVRRERHKALAALGGFFG